MNNNYQNILVIRTDRIGDVVLTLPAIKALNDAYPKSKVSLLVAQQTKELLEGVGGIDEILVDDKKGLYKGVVGFFKLVGLIKSKRFDLVVNFHTKKRTNLLCYLSKIPKRLGYKNNKFGFLLNEPVDDKRQLGEKHEAEYCLELLSAIGVKNELSLPKLVASQESQDWANQFFAQNHINKGDPIIVIHSGASDPSKCWPTNRFAELIDQVIERYNCRVLLVGGSETRNISRKVTSLTKENPIDLTGLTSLGQLVSIFQMSKLLVSNDSGPVHVAAGSGIPVVSIFTRNQPGINPERWRPLSKNSKTISVPPTDNLDFKKSDSADAKYLELIQLQEVLEAVDAIFKLC